MTERCLLRGASGNLAGHEGPRITGRKGVEGRGLTAVKEIFTMLVISGVLPPLGRFDGHVVEGAARIETREEGHNWTIAGGEKSVKKFLRIDSEPRAFMCICLYFSAYLQNLTFLKSASFPQGSHTVLSP